MSVDPLSRPWMPAAPGVARHRPVVSAGKRRFTLGALPLDVVETLEGWGEGASATSVVVAMVRRLAEADVAALRAAILADATEVFHEGRRR